MASPLALLLALTCWEYVDAMVYYNVEKVFLKEDFKEYPIAVRVIQEEKFAQPDRAVINYNIYTVIRERRSAEENGKHVLVADIEFRRLDETRGKRLITLKFDSYWDNPEDKLGQLFSSVRYGRVTEDMVQVAGCAYVDDAYCYLYTITGFGEGQKKRITRKHIPLERMRGLKVASENY